MPPSVLGNEAQATIDRLPGTAELHRPATQGDLVRVPMPALTEERRKELIKVVRHEAENARVAVRNLRRDGIHHLKELLKAKSISEDQERRSEDEMQKLTDRHIAEVDKILQQKEADLMAV